MEIHTGSIVTDVDRTGSRSRRHDGEVERVEARTKIWAAGVQASPLAKMLADASGAECDRAGRVAVLPDCSLPGHPEVFAIGDMAALDGLPGVAEVAMQQGIHASKTIERRLRGEDRGRSATATSAAWRRSRASARWSASRGSASPASSGG